MGWDTKGAWRWITRRYFQLEEEQLQAHIRKYQIVERLLAVQQRQHKARQAAEQEHMAAIEALLQRQKALAKPVVEFVYHEAGTYPSVAREGSPEFAMGVPVYVRGKPYAVICPVASRLPALRRRLASLVFFVASERERSRVSAQAAPGQRIEVLTAELAAASPPVVLPQQDQGGLTVRQAVNRMLGLDRM
ncbi:hypothetical protein ACWC6I_40605 [Streptomyces sp. NPDC001414]